MTKSCLFTNLLLSPACWATKAGSRIPGRPFGGPRSVVAVQLGAKVSHACHHLVPRIYPPRSPFGPPETDLRPKGERQETQRGFAPVHAPNGGAGEAKLPRLSGRRPDAWSLPGKEAGRVSDPTLTALQGGQSAAEPADRSCHSREACPRESGERESRETPLGGPYPSWQAQHAVPLPRTNPTQSLFGKEGFQGVAYGGFASEGPALPRVAVRGVPQLRSDEPPT
jgi:hypothetical protein